ncbi:MAG: CBS domain-containing protein [Sandaracinaceae bacterium]|nr:CBS domain-containing protein [Sandaracinaceae bacterium]
MTTDVVTLAEEQDVLFATSAMNLRRIRHLPVVRGDALVGLVSHRDLLRAQARFLAQVGERGEAGSDTTIASVLARDVMTADVRTVSPETPADEAAMILVDTKFGCLPVVNEGTLVGIVTEADFLRWAVGVLASSNA